MEYKKKKGRQQLLNDNIHKKVALPAQMFKGYTANIISLRPRIYLDSR